jgi:hypothetical protein
MSDESFAEFLSAFLKTREAVEFQAIHAALAKKTEAAIDQWKAGHIAERDFPLYIAGELAQVAFEFSRDFSLALLRGYHQWANHR